MADQTEIVIHPVSPQGGRKVTVHALGVDADLGRAFTPGDVSEFLSRAGLEDVDLSEDGPIRWEGAAPRCGPATPEAAGPPSSEAAHPPAGRDRRVELVAGGGRAVFLAPDTPGRGPASRRVGQSRRS